MIGIARILLKDPDVLIFDEANAYLDKDSMELLKEVIKKEKRTCIIVSHQPDFIDVADRVFHLQKCKIVK
jgi:ABC-type bacteriocin/lantibiotic exporter with double-glycine peptidase domain